MNPRKKNLVFHVHSFPSMEKGENNDRIYRKRRNDQNLKEKDPKIQIFSNQQTDKSSITSLSSNKSINQEDIKRKIMDEEFDLNEPYRNLYLHKIPRDRLIDDEMIFLHGLPKSERAKYLYLRNMILYNWQKNKIMTFNQLLKVIDNEIVTKLDHQLVLKKIWKFLYERLYITNILHNNIDDPLQDDLPYGFNQSLTIDYGNHFINSNSNNRRILLIGNNKSKIISISNLFKIYGLNDIVIIFDENNNNHLFNRYDIYQRLMIDYQDNLMVIRNSLHNYINFIKNMKDSFSFYDAHGNPLSNRFIQNSFNHYIEFVNEYGSIHNIDRSNNQYNIKNITNELLNMIKWIDHRLIPFIAGMNLLKNFNNNQKSTSDLNNHDNIINGKVQMINEDENNLLFNTVYFTHYGTIETIQSDYIGILPKSYVPLDYKSPIERNYDHEECYINILLLFQNDFWDTDKDFIGFIDEVYPYSSIYFNLKSLTNENIIMVCMYNNEIMVESDEILIKYILEKFKLSFGSRKRSQDDIKPPLKYIIHRWKNNPLLNNNYLNQNNSLDKRIFIFNEHKKDEEIKNQIESIYFQIMKKFPNERFSDLFHSNDDFYKSMNEKISKVVIPRTNYSIPNIEISDVSVVI